MAKILIVMIAVLASFMMVESLICTKCSYGVLGFCLSSSEETCKTNGSVCFNGTLSFTAFSSLGLRSEGCRASSNCNETSGTLLGLAYTSKLKCCSTDRCANAAPSTKMTLTAVIGVAALASMWSSIM